MLDCLTWHNILSPFCFEVNRSNCQQDKFVRFIVLPFGYTILGDGNVFIFILYKTLFRPLKIWLFEL